MLSIEEFTVGSIAQASPLTLVLGLDAYEPPTLIGSANDKAVAVQLAGPQAFNCYTCNQRGENTSLLVTNIRIEVEVASAFNPQYESIALGNIVRTEHQLTIRARFPNSFRPSDVILHDDLPSTGRHHAGFRRWQIVQGEGLAKHILWESPQSEQ